MSESKRPIQSSKTVHKNASKFIAASLNAYDPEQDFGLRNIKNPIVSFFERMQRPGADGKLHDLVESASIIEVNRLGLIRTRKVNGTAELREAMQKSSDNKEALHKIAESGIKFRREDSLTEKERKEFRELAKSSIREDNSTDDNENTYDDYIPIMGGPWSHQLYLHDYLDMMAKCFEAYNHNPYAHQGVKLITHFVLGRGVVYKAHNPLVQQRFKAWWDANQMDDRLEAWSDMLSRDGELLVRRFKNPVTQEMFLRWISPSTIWEIVTDIEDIERAYYYHQQYPAAYQVLYGSPIEKGKQKFNPNKFETCKYIINQIPADEVYAVKINVGPDEKRGRSDLFCILSWLKRHKDHQTGVVLKAIVQSVFAWKNKLKGDQTDVNAYVSAFGTDVPDFGSVHVENESSDLTPMTPDSGANSIQDAPSLVSTIAVGLGIPVEFFGGTGGTGGASNRAQAVVGSEPGIKKFQGRQLLLGRFLNRIADDWVKNEMDNGRLPEEVPGDDPDLSVVLRWLQKAIRRFPAIAQPINLIVRFLAGQTLMVPLDGEIEFQFPEIAVEDRSAKIKDLQIALQDKVYDHKSYASAVAKELGNHDYDYEDAQEKIAADTASGRGVADLYGMGGLASTSPEGPAAVEPSEPPGGLPGEEKRSVRQTYRR